MDRRHALALAALLTTAVACSPGPASTTLPGEPGAVLTGVGTALAPFDACDDVLHWFQDEALKRVGPYGLPGATRILAPAAEVGGDTTRASSSVAPAAPAAQDATSAAGADTGPAFSGTNVQEPGADEPDIVKTDGRRLFAVSNNPRTRTGVDDELRIVDVTGRSPALAARLTLPGSAETQLLLQGHRLLAIGQAPALSSPVPAPPAVGPGGRRVQIQSIPDSGQAATRLTLIDVADPARPTIVHTSIVEGRYVDARLAGDRARVVTTSTPGYLPFVLPTDGSARALDTARRANEDAIRRSTIDDWLPHVRPPDAPAGDHGRLLVPCEHLRHPREFSGFDTLTVQSLDLAGPALDPGDTIGLVAGGDTVYGTDRTLYVATDPVQPDRPVTDQPVTPETVGPRPVLPPVPVPPARTAIHAFGLTGGGPATYRASGEIAGNVGDRWALSEYAGHLRVVSSTGPAGCTRCPGSQSQVSVLAEQDGALVVVGTAGDMGHGENVKAVRFVGDRAYVVTFREVDPFYVLDLHDPARPAVVGELKIPGFSSYLHPVGDHLVLGIGRSGTRDTATKISLFDVADPARPREVAQRTVDDAYSPAAFDAHAFLWWAPTRLAVVPVASFFNTERAAVAYRVDTGAGTLDELGQIAAANTTRLGQRNRSVVVGPAIYTLTEDGVRATTLDTLQDRGWLPL